MPKNRRTLLLVSFLMLLFSFVSTFVLHENKYYVKKFIKRHDALYTVAKKIASVKKNLLGLLNGSSSKEQAFDRSLYDRTDWSLVFDASQFAGESQPFWGNIGYESFKNGILTRLNRDLFNMMKETNSRTHGAFRYIRAHNLFSDGRPPWGEGVVQVDLDESGRISCNWESADRVFDTILSHGFRPIVELSFMPDALASIPDRRQKWGKANISPPKDYRQWRELVFKTVNHLCARYGEPEVSQWYFEVWNEPDLGYLFWIEDPKRKPYGDVVEYMKLYDYAVAGAKSACSSIRIGGPASAGGFIRELLEHVFLEDSYAGDHTAPRIDFISTHAYGYINERPRKGMNILEGIRWRIGRLVSHDHDLIRRSIPDIPFLLTEVGYKLRGEVNNTRFMAVWLAKLVSMLFDLGDTMGAVYQPREIVYWADMQIAKDFGDERGLVASLRTMRNRQIYKRPIYNAFEALGHLSNQRIKLTEGPAVGGPVYGVATRDLDKSVEILLYHLDEKDEENANKDSLDINLTVRNLPFDHYKVSFYLVDETHSNGYTVWKQMGKPSKLTEAQHVQLSSSDDLALVREPWLAYSESHDFSYDFRLQPNSLALLVLTRYDPEHGSTY